MKELIEKLSMEIIMADRNDAGALENIQKTLTFLINIPQHSFDENLKIITRAAAAMLSYSERAFSTGVEAIDEALDVLSRAVGSMQVITEGNRQPGEVSFPDELGMPDACGQCIENELTALHSNLCRLSSLASVNNRKETARAAIMLAGIIEKISNKKTIQAGEIPEAMKAWGAAAEEIAGRRPPADAKEPDRGERQASSCERQASGGRRQATGDERQAETVELNADMSLLSDFVNEASEHAENAEKNMLVLEKDRENKEAVNSVFRAFHTLKSLSGFLGLDEVNALVKETENLLAKIRKAEIRANDSVIEMLFCSVDLLKKMIKNISESLKTGCKMRREQDLAAQVENIKNAAEMRAANETVNKNTTDPENKTDAQFPGASQMRETVKIDSSKLDRLIDTIGEMVIAESMINSDNAAMLMASGDYFKNIGHLNKTTKRLHELGLALRLVPLAPVMQKMERIVRDLAKTHNKKINFTVSGEETEIDRSVVEKINDPLVHMLRNAVDHGLEKNVEERIKAGKPGTGEIRINAYHRSGNVVIEVIDDGQGLDRERILMRGIENGLVNRDVMPADAEIYSLIFRPGFSTAKVVTDTSGRGVGMDVVKRNVEELRGRVDIETQKGKGTKFTILLPITTAIIEAMVVSVNKDKYLLPTLSIVESVKAEPAILSTVTGKGMVVNLRGRLIPVFSLKGLFFSVREKISDIAGKIIVIVEEDGRMAGIIVDDLLEQQQIVVKSMSKGLEKTEGIAGCTIMSDGKVGLILDAAEILNMALTADTGDEIAGEHAEPAGIS